VSGGFAIIMCKSAKWVGPGQARGASGYASSMCLIALAWQAHSRFELALASNRDEFHGRPTDPAAFAADEPAVFGGRDRVQGGGWLQVHAAGRLAAVTNVRDGLAAEVAPRSRGALVHGFVRDPVTTTAALPAHAAQYGRFNLVTWDGQGLAFASNHPQWRTRPVEPGVHGLSNGDLDAPWPKVAATRDALAAWLAGADAIAEEPAVDALFVALANTARAADARLPDTGVGLPLERALSAAFIVGAEYGTRCSTVVLVARDAIWFHERRFGPDGEYIGQTRRRLART
jgi:uncharacterized protein with NRDE domain